MREIMADFVYVTEEGLQKMKEELEQLRNERPVIARLIADARDKGDLTENAEYSAAKEVQNLHEMKMARLEDQLARSRVIDSSRIDTKSVQILNRVTIKNKMSGMVMKYQIVPESEANLKEGKIANTSPIARGIMGKKVGEVVDVNVPAGIIHLEIVAISM